MCSFSCKEWRYLARNCYHVVLSWSPFANSYYMHKWDNFDFWEIFLKKVMRRRRRLLSCPDFLIANCCGPFVCLLASSCGTSLTPISLSLIFSVTHGPVPLNFFLSNLCPFCCKLQNFGNLRGNLWSYFGRYYKSVIYRSVSFMDWAPGLENI